MTEKLKNCRLCKKLLPLEQFSFKKHSLTKLRDRCENCYNSPAAQYNYKNPEKTKKALQKYRENGGTRLLRLKKIHGITQEEYLERLAKQNGTCAICGDKESKGKWKAFNIDHCHKTKKIRGLLCGNCNRGLGYFKDDINFLTRAIKYLDNNGSPSPNNQNRRG